MIASMLCVNPHRKPGVEFGCGQCLPCRINRRRTWTGRIALELAGTIKAGMESSFITLTYADEYLPRTPGGVPTLSNEHWRKLTKGIGYRYFGCGEYGDQTWRPHYHLLAFGLYPTLAEEFIKARWPYGHVGVTPACFEHAGYISGYVVKKMTKEADERLQLDQVPEFARMSRRPAVGRLGLKFMEEFITSTEGARYVAAHQDVPQAVRVNGKVYPLGRTMVAALRASAGLPAQDPARLARYKEKRLQEDLIPGVVIERENKRSRQYDRVKGGLFRRQKGTL